MTKRTFAHIPVNANKVKHLLRFWRSFILVPRIQDNVKEMTFSFLYMPNLKILK
jgi:hypothetical protein